MAKETDAKPIKLNDRQTVYATAKAHSHKEGEEIEVHPLQAAALIKSGKATEKPAKGK